MARKTKTHEQICANQVAFIENTLGSPLWSVQKNIVRKVQKNSVVAIKSCHGSGKTHSIARIVHAFLFSYPNSIVITTAPTFRQVEQILWRYIRKAHKVAKIELGGQMFKTKYELDEDWYAIGVSADVPENFVGFHAEHILVLFDEASGISDAIYEAAQGLLTSSGARLVLIGNPTKRTGEFYRAFTDKGTAKITISCFDTPNFVDNDILKLEDLTEEKAQKAKLTIPALITPRWVYNLIAKYGKDSDVVRVRALGKFPKKDPDTLIGVDMIEGAIGASHEQVGEQLILGVDVARFGDDATEFVERHGNHAKILMKYFGDDTMTTAGHTARWLRANPNGVAHVDVIGVGAGVVDRLKEQDDIADRVVEVNSAATPNDPEQYINLRAEGWDATRDWLVSEDVVLGEGEYDDDWYELAQPRYKYNSRGKLQIEAKEDMKKRKIASPNGADALVLTLTFPPQEIIIEPRIRNI